MTKNKPTYKAWALSLVGMTLSVAMMTTATALSHTPYTGLFTAICGMSTLITGATIGAVSITAMSILTKQGIKRVRNN